MVEANGGSGGGGGGGAGLLVVMVAVVVAAVALVVVVAAVVAAVVRTPGAHLWMHACTRACVFVFACVAVTAKGRYKTCAHTFTDL